MGDVAALTWPLTRPGGPPLPLPSNRARRCLFGSPDHEGARRHIEQQMDKMLQQDRLRWNFDFETGRPLTGRYKWEKLGGGADDDDDGGADGSDDAAEDDATSAPAAKREEQTHITDFMRKRKSSNQKDFVTQRPKTRRRSS